MIKYIVPFVAVIGIAVSATAGTTETIVRPPSEPGVHREAENVILITSDGLRWQEVFRGMNREMLTKRNKVESPEELLAKYDAPTTNARRAKLMPFLWNKAVKQGEFFGNQDKGSIAQVSNNMWFSYPGYNELVTGHPDDERVKSNKALPNPNGSVFGWLNRAPQLHGTVAGAAAWSTIGLILGAEKYDFPFATIKDNDDFKKTARFLKKNKPHVMFLGFSLTDHFAHQGDYTKYLNAAHNVDQRLGKLWKLLQSMPQYRDKTTIIFTADHGRGNSSKSPKAWRSHGRKMPGSNGIFIAVWGPDTPKKGEISDGPKLKQAQVAATVASAIGYDYPAAESQAAPPIKQAFEKK